MMLIERFVEDKMKVIMPVRRSGTAIGKGGYEYCIYCK